MTDILGMNFRNFYNENILEYLKNLYENPLNLIILILDISIVIVLLIKVIKFAKDSRAWQLLKGISLLVVATIVISILNFKILNFILSSIMTWGVFALIVIFQPELRKALEQLGTNKFTKFFGIDKDIEKKTK